MSGIVLTVGELTEMLRMLPDETTLMFTCLQMNMALGFSRLRGAGNNTLQIELDALTEERTQELAAEA